VSPIVEPVASAPPPAASSTSRSRPPHPVRAPRGPCNPPFTMDDGIRVPKPGCR
jgi:hypothetical protein